MVRPETLSTTISLVADCISGSIDELYINIHTLEEHHLIGSPYNSNNIR